MGIIRDVLNEIESLFSRGNDLADPASALQDAERKFKAAVSYEFEELKRRVESLEEFHTHPEADPEPTIIGDQPEPTPADGSGMLRDATSTGIDLLNAQAAGVEVLHDQAGNVIDGKTEVPGPAPAAAESGPTAE